MVGAVIPPRRSLRILLTGAVLIAAVWLLHPLGAPPLYDGAAGPNEAYRYLNPPAGHTQQGPPTSASTNLAVSGGSSAAGYVSTSEAPPQAQFLVG